MLNHGGQLLQAANYYQIPIEQWIDLSTGINPNGWPVPNIPSEVWLRLPEQDDGLIEAAQSYYRCQSILPVAGSQSAIQTLPRLIKTSKVACLYPSYAEHRYNWMKYGHTVVKVKPHIDAIDLIINEVDILLLVNPNNPSGHVFTTDQLLKWHHQLAKKNGWLIIDEAFADMDLGHSLSSYPIADGLVILRSLGKFFGLAGIRCGFVIGSENLLNDIESHLGPWTINNPGRYVAKQALLDTTWQINTLQSLNIQSKRLNTLLLEFGLPPSGGTDLFQWCKTPSAANIHHQLCTQGILCRLFDHPTSLRFGLPKDEPAWQQLKAAFQHLHYD